MSQRFNLTSSFIYLYSRTITLFALCAGLSWPLSVNALESNVELHHGFEAKSFGYAIGLADQFTVRSPFGWALSYHHISQLSAKWNGDELFFDSATIDTMFTYRFRTRGYNKFINKLSYQVQAGASWQLTDNQFIWEDLEQVKIFSERGDINPVLAFVSHYKYSKKMTSHFGIKYYPKFSEFDAVTTLYAGITYRFGYQYGY